MDKKQRIFILEGPDQCAKTEIGKHLSSVLDIPYFKNSVEKKAFADDDVNYFQNCMRYAEPFFLDYLKQSGSSIIMDRGYVSEAIYSFVFKRQSDPDLIRKLDELYGELKTFIVFCYRVDYSGWKDDFDPRRIDENRLWEIDLAYRTFLNTSSCRVISLCVDSHDLVEQTKTILKCMKAYEEMDKNDNL